MNSLIAWAQRTESPPSACCETYYTLTCLFHCTFTHNLIAFSYCYFLQLHVTAISHWDAFAKLNSSWHFVANETQTQTPDGMWQSKMCLPCAGEHLCKDCLYCMSGRRTDFWLYIWRLSKEHTSVFACKHTFHITAHQLSDSLERFRSKLKYVDWQNWAQRGWIPRPCLLLIIGGPLSCNQQIKRPASETPPKHYL